MITQVYYYCVPLKYTNFNILKYIKNLFNTSKLTNFKKH